MCEGNGKVEGHIRQRLPGPGFRYLATVGDDGTPQTSPVRADLEGAYAMVDTAIGRAKGENLRRNPAASLSHHDAASWPVLISSCCLTAADAFTRAGAPDRGVAARTAAAPPLTP
ncbi:hypothetical protein DI272_15875 [Streptomyces sp. Act143]|nr:hypothetical protein DI272_15875 [Streptomyces sp. Act143]